MDDKAAFGPEFHRLGFGEAVKQDLLSDYKVLVIAVDELHVSQVLNKRIAKKEDELKLDDAVKIVGCWNGLGKHLAKEDGADLSADPQPMRTAIAFAQSIKHSKLLSEEFERISKDLSDQIDYLPMLEARHVDGTMNVVERNKKLTWLKDNIGKNDEVCRILSNARCLSEGVDVPALDAAIFLNPRDSVVDVVQSVGRVMRKDPAGRKKYGYVILPIGIKRDSDPTKALDDNKKYRVVWQVLNALRAHDDRLDKQFAHIDLSGKSNGVVGVIGVGGGGEEGDNFGGDQLGFEFDPEELGKWQDALFAKIVHKCGNRRYWEDWAKDVAEIAERHQMRIRAMLDKPYSKAKKAFDEYLRGVRKSLNPSISQEEAIEMLAQHVITKPVFEALFEGYEFAGQNPVSKSMQKIMDILEEQALEKEHETLEGFYASVRERASGITDPKGRQRIIIELYDKFFKTAFPKLVDLHGIVYTPVEIVDFILHSADTALQEHFGKRLADEGVDILDPFTGTGTFPVRLIESGLIPPEKLGHKYRKELHANEIVLLAYYIAAINVEEAMHRVSGQEYEPFPGIVLTDTFQMTEAETGELETGMPENHERADRQKARDIRVIVGNPPYSVGQDDANDNNQKLSYLRLDGRIAATYATHSKAVNKNSLYDSYIRAFRWASDRIKDEGIVCFVTNGGWIDGNTMSGFRKTLRDEFSDIYVFNLRGNQRTSGELSRKEGGKVFGSGSRTPVAITLLVKRKDADHLGRIHYHDIGDYLTREQKLAIVTDFGNYQALPLKEIHPNDHHDWINHRSADFEEFVALNDGPGAIFELRSNGVQTNRDDWVYNFSRVALESNVSRMIDFYNLQMKQHGKEIQEAGNAKDKERAANRLLDMDSKKIKWTSSLISELCRGNDAAFDASKLVEAIYRPFCKMNLYYDDQFNHRFKERLMPSSKYQTISIQVTGAGEGKDFSCLISGLMPNLHTISGGQCFPLHWYEKASSSDLQSGLSFNNERDAKPDANGYIRREGVTDVALANFRKHYNDESITKEDIFFYVYGVLNSPEYREKYAADLKKMLPRIPMVPNFQYFMGAGRNLAALHLNYEELEPWPVVVESEPMGDFNEFAHYRITKMRFKSLGGREKDKSTIIYNSKITIKSIPEEAYRYVVNGKSAIEWIMERYQVTVDKDSGIKNDPNAWCVEHNDPTYILNLLRRVVRVSVETVRIVEAMPPISQ